MTPASAPLIMIVDDEPKNLDVLDAMLRQAGFDVAAFLSGDLALEAAAAFPPALLLLDVRMPVMDGYEVCRRFKADARLADIPIIFLSALTEAKDKIQAFDAGAVDYIAKPLSQPEVLARVRTHLALRNQSLALEQQVEARTRELKAANDHLRALSQARAHWVSMVGHELRTPLTGVFCIASALFEVAPKDSPLHEMRQDYQSCFERIRKLIDDATFLASLDADAEAFLVQAAVPFAGLVTAALAEAAAHSHGVRFDCAAETLPARQLRRPAELLRRALTDLLVTAAHCTPPHQPVTLTSQSGPDTVTLRIATCGKRLPEEELAVFFDLGEQHTLHKGGADFGFGPTLAYRVLTRFGATVTVENGRTEGIVLAATFPVPS